MQSNDDIAAIQREGALLLSCKYKSQKGVAFRNYWFEQVPEHVQYKKIDPALQPYFAKIAGPATTCPARE